MKLTRRHIALLDAAIIENELLKKREQEKRPKPMTKDEFREAVMRELGLDA